MQVQPPTKQCRSCGAVTQTFDTKCPHCQKKYKQGGSAVKIVLGVLAGLVLLGTVTVVGCAALIGSAANEAVKSLDAEQQAHAITKDQYDAVKIGWSESKVISELGKEPENKQEFENESFVGDEPSNSSCIYYNKDGGDFGDVFQFCFDEKKLTSKNAY